MRHESSSRGTRRKLVAFALAAGTLAAIAGLLALKLRPTDPAAEFMAEQYGEYDDTTETWAHRPLVDGQFVHRICARQEIRIKEQAHIMLAACGAELDAPSGSSMSVDFYVLTENRGQVVAVASLQDAVSYGGNVQPTSVEVVRLGHEFYGFESSSTYVAEGYIIPGMTLFVPHKNTLTDALSMSTGEDNRGTVRCDKTGTDEPAGDECLLIERTVRIDNSNPTQRVFPIEIMESRQSGDSAKRPEVRKFTLRFDPKQWRFIAPKDLELTLG